MTIDTASPPAPESETVPLEFEMNDAPAIAILRRLVADAVQKRMLEGEDARKVMRFINSF